MRVLAFALLVVVTVTEISISQDLWRAEQVGWIDRSVKIPISKQEATCEPGKRFQDYCNSCLCSHDGKFKICTQFTCSLKDLLIRDGVLSPDKYVEICEPDSMFGDDCNDCYCSADGLTASCTYRLCLPEITPRKASAIEMITQQKCKPNATYTNECNQCICDDEGRAVDCTARACIPKSRKNSNSDTIESPIIACPSGQEFDNVCNACRCSDDGTTAWCYLKRCTSYEELPDAIPIFKNEIIIIESHRLPYFQSILIQFTIGCQTCNGLPDKSMICRSSYCQFDESEYLKTPSSLEPIVAGIRNKGHKSVRMERFYDQTKDVVDLVPPIPRTGGRCVLNASLTVPVRPQYDAV